MEQYKVDSDNERISPDQEPPQNSYDKNLRELSTDEVNQILDTALTNLKTDDDQVTLNEDDSDLGSLSARQYKKCFNHPLKNVQLFCLECNKLVCSECIVESHQRHKFCSIEEAATRVRADLQYALSPVKTWYENDAKTTCSNLKVSEDNYVTQSDSCVEEIKTRAQQLHDEIDSMKDRLINEVDDRRKTDVEQLKSLIGSLGDRLDNTSDVIEKCQKTISDSNDITLLRSEKEVSTMISNVNMGLSIKEPLPASFIAGATSEEKLMELFGHCRRPDEKEIFSKSTHAIRPNKRLDIIRQSAFEIGHGGAIHTIAPNPNSEEEVWVSSMSNPKNVRLATVDGQIQLPSEFDFAVRDISVSRPGDLLFSCYDMRCIKRLRLNGSIETFINTSPFHPIGIHATRSGDVLACLVDEDDTYSRPGRPISKRQVAIISKGGKITKRLSKSAGQGMKLFTLPIKVTETMDEEICVIDKVAKNKGRVMIFDRNESIRAFYSGPRNSKKGVLFCPTDLCSDIYGHIIVSDSGSNAIHMLDKFGQALRVHHIGRDWISVPMSIGCDHRGTLFVGDFSGTLHVLKYL